MSKKKKVLIICISIVLVISLTVGIIMGVSSNNGDPVSVYSMEILNSNWFESEAELSGFITSDFVQEVYENHTYNVKKVYVKQGDKVKVGDVLVKYDMEEQELDLQLQDLTIQSQELEIKDLEKRIKKLKNTKIKGKKQKKKASVLDGLFLEVCAEEKGEEGSTATDESDEPVEPDPSSESTTETKPDPKPETESLLSKLKSVDQKAATLSGDGKTVKKQYVYLLKKSDDEDDEIIKGNVINELMRRGLYFTIREYDSQEAYDKGHKPIAEVTVKPDTQFSKSFDETGYSIKTISERMIKVKSLKLKAKNSTVKQGETTIISATLKGTNVSAASITWKLSGNKSVATILSNGMLKIGASESASKVTITASCCGVKAKTSVKVKKINNGGRHNGHFTDPDVDDDDDFRTKEELQEAIEAAEEELERAKMDLNSAKLSYEAAKKQVDEGTVKANVDGKVTSAYSEKSLPGQGEPMVVIRGESGIYVTTAVNELDLDTVKIGGTISVSSYETGQEYEAVVRDISPYPTENTNYSAANSNPNSSSYPMTAYIEDAEGLKIGESVGIKYNASSMGTIAENKIYVNKAYVRSESGKSYVYKMNKSKRLAKCYVKTGEVMYGQYVEIVSGVSMKDYIAFPYGKRVKEGAKAEISDNEENIIY